MVSPWPRDSLLATIKVAHGFELPHIEVAERSRFCSPLQISPRGDARDGAGRSHGRSEIGCHRLIGALRGVVIEIQELRSQGGVDCPVVNHNFLIKPLLAPWSGDGVNAFIDVIGGGILEDCARLVGTAFVAIIAYRPPLEITWRWARSRWGGVI